MAIEKYRFSTEDEKTLFFPSSSPSFHQLADAGQIPA
jgi:hypothetical protein